MQRSSSVYQMAMLCLALFGLFVCFTTTTNAKEDSKPDWAKKDIRDYTDADMERLLEQWDKDDEPLPEDELPEHLRPSAPLDMSKMDLSNPENMIKMSKKGKTLMAFVSVAGQPTREQTETLTALWQSSLQNNHLIAERFIISDDRAIFMFKDGSQAWDAKDFLVQQEQCKEVTIENKAYPGKGFTKSEHQEL